MQLYVIGYEGFAKKQNVVRWFNQTEDRSARAERGKDTSESR